MDEVTWPPSYERALFVFGLLAVVVLAVLMRPATAGAPWWALLGFGVVTVELVGMATLFLGVWIAQDLQQTAVERESR